MLDAIERKDATFSVDRLMEFTDEFIQNYGTRLPLILETDRFADKAVWQKFQEKIVDVEISLAITPAEAHYTVPSGSPASMCALQPINPKTNRGKV